MEDQTQTQTIATPQPPQMQSSEQSPATPLTQPMTSVQPLASYATPPQVPMMQPQAPVPAPSTAYTPPQSNGSGDAPSPAPISTIASSTTGASSNSPQDAIIAQQQAQIEALMGQNAVLNAQVVQMIQGGAQITEANGQPQPQQVAPQVQQMMQMGMQPDPLGQLNTPSLTSSQDYTLEALASEIGKPSE